MPGEPPWPSIHPGAGSSGSMTAHSASVMSEGYRRAQVLRDPAGQHRQATAVPGPEGALSRRTRYKAIKGSWCGRGVDTTAATRSPLRCR